MEKNIDKRRLRSLKIKAEQSYLDGKYSESTRAYSRILIEHNGDLESRVGLILADMALEQEEESRALYDYYQLLKRKHNEKAHEIMLEVVQGIDDTKATSEGMLADTIRGVLYSDFRELVAQRGDFKRAFEDLIFSSKIVITSKEEFLEFVDSLIEHGFSDTAMNYLESASSVFLYEPRFQKLYQKAAER